MNCLVTGGGGFLGSAIVRTLHARGDHVVALGRNRYPHIAQLGVRCIQADLRDGQAVSSAAHGMDVVFHAGAMAGIWGAFRDFWSVNVEGTCNVVNACLVNSVPRLVYTSSPSVVFGEDDLSGVDESQPYPRRHFAAYPETKAVAERLVLKANSARLSTVALRPHLIWGPGDPHLIPRVIDRARKRRLRVVGHGRNMVDITFIENAAEAHILAADALGRPGAACAGKAYFISQGEPVILWDWLNELLERLKIPPVTRRVPFPVARYAGALCELVYRLAGFRAEPPMTTFVAFQLAKNHYFNIAAARRDLGYAARVTTAVGLTKLVKSLAFEAT